MKTRHLDLGCGFSPKNPYKRSDLFGCDIRRISDSEDLNCFEYKQANLITEAIPFANDYFDSVSAYDFLEHIPRQILLPNGLYINPFIILMNEVHRVLKPQGLFLASTPAFPSVAAFSDPTHVNFITEHTHEYFVGANATAKIYGFTGVFDVLHARWDTPHNSADPSENSIRKKLRRIHRRILHGGLTHMYWELTAKK